MKPRGSSFQAKKTALDRAVLGGVPGVFKDRKEAGGQSGA